MKKMKRRTICLSLCLASFFVAAIVTRPANTFAVTEERVEETAVTAPVTQEEKKEVVKSVQSVFEDKTVQVCETLYNLDGSADYISVEFENGGYAVFAKRTMEMMEYSPEGSLPYEDTASKKYYAGPANYLQKEGGAFLDVMSGEKLEISAEEAVTFSKQVRETLVEQKISDLKLGTYEGTAEDVFGSIPTMPASAPELDRDNLITPTGGTDGLIPNYRYFFAEPTIGDNSEGLVAGKGNTGTCGPVAAQLLLSYNNYYNDRRIIPDRYLNGYDDTTNSVTDKSKNPNYCTDPMSMTSDTLGTRSEPTGENSFYSKMVTTIMKPNTRGASNKEVYTGIDAYLRERLPDKGHSMEFVELSIGSLGSLVIRTEIAAGRPIIVSIDKRLNGSSNHDVVAYGCQSYTYPTGEGTYDGYVVHYGHKGTGKNRVWINSSWCDGYISLKINHTHYYDEVGTIAAIGKTECKCVTCGHRTYADSVISLLAGEACVERQVPLTAGVFNDDIEYYLSFQTSGNKMIQTFGRLGAGIYLYDSNHNYLASNFDSGYEVNSILNYNFQADTQYCLHILPDNTPRATDVLKVVIAPTQTVYSSYDDFPNMGGNMHVYESIDLNSTYLTTIKPNASGKYAITVFNRQNRVYGTCLYIIDPVTGQSTYVDSGADTQTYTTIALMAYRPYFVVVGFSNVATQSGDFSIQIVKTT